jgi:hypothetical protein
MNFFDAATAPACYPSIEESTKRHVDLYNSLSDELFELRLDFESDDEDNFFITEDFLAADKPCPDKLPILIELKQRELGKLLDAKLIKEHDKIDVYYKNTFTNDIFVFKRGFLNKVEKDFLVKKSI